MSVRNKTLTVAQVAIAFAGSAGCGVLIGLTLPARVVVAVGEAATQGVAVLSTRSIEWLETLKGDEVAAEVVAEGPLTGEVV